MSHPSPEDASAIEITREAGVATLTLRRPEARNALTPQLFECGASARVVYPSFHRFASVNLESQYLAECAVVNLVRATLLGESCGVCQFFIDGSDYFGGKL